MTQTFELTIADVAFSVSTPAGVEIVENDPDYPAFLVPPGRGPDVLRFEFGLELDEPGIPDQLRPIFDTGEAWKAYRDGDDTLLTIPAPSGFSGHLWVVRLFAAGPPHRIFCGPAMIDRADDRTVVANPLRYPLDQILMMHLLTPHQGVIVHAAGFHRNGVGAFFAGISGAGKSTLTGLVGDSLGLLPLSDDRVIVRKTSSGIRVFGTPWPGEARVAVNQSAKLGAIVILRQAGDHSLRELDPREALERLLPTVSVLWYHPELAAAALDWCGELLGALPAYELSFRRDEGVVATIDELFGYFPG